MGPSFNKAMSKHLDIGFFEFFIELSSNNNKTWFDQNRLRYEQQVKKPFELFLQQIIDGVSKTDKSFSSLLASGCIFRINKDVRFSKDKTPYKLHRSAVISPGGRKDMSGKGFYIEVGPEACGFYAGSYMPEKEQLNNIRTQIATNPEEWRKITNSKNFLETFGGVKGNRQVKGDIRFKAIAEALPEVKNTQFYIQHSMEPELFLEPDIVSYIVGLWNKAKPFSSFISQEK
jgi:uncharacterized protein (TIGR02453 family)